MATNHIFYVTPGTELFEIKGPGGTVVTGEAFEEDAIQLAGRLNGAAKKGCGELRKMLIELSEDDE